MAVSHSCDDSRLATYEVEEVRRGLRWALGGLPRRSDSFLDVGCGSSGDGAAIREHATYLGIDHTPGILPKSRPPYVKYRGGTVDDLPEGATYTVVLSKRMLCQNPTESHRSLLERLWSRVRPLGCLVVCEPVQGHREALNEAREFAGLKPLPRPWSGGNCLNLPEAVDLLGKAWYNEPVAPDYVVWTRYLCEALTGRIPRYTQGIWRECPFKLNPKLRELAFYRVVIWSK